MTYDTFESLKKGDRVKMVGRKRIYTVGHISPSLVTGKRVVYVAPIDAGRSIFAAADKNHSSHYINWDRVS
jgi:hypothetical protein